MQTALFLLLFLKWSTCQRRITNGSKVDHRVNTNFMVSIVSAKELESIPGWLCGGSIIHPQLVLTSASCLHTVSQMYVIAGYRKYVRTEDLDRDICTRHMRKRIIYYCLHSEHGLLTVNIGDKHTSEERKYKWTIFDIGIAKTETPFDFYDSNYVKYCSYLPNSILVNFHKKYELKDTDVVVYGWGHADHYRPTKDRHNYNAETLRYASSKILSTKECKTKFMSRYIQADINVNYICADGKGNLNANGKYLDHKSPKMNRCGENRRSGNSSISKCVYYTKSAKKKLSNDTQTPNTIFKNTRRNGICQNDHGSPLVRWIGGHPYVIGVASAFQVNKKMECVGPYLYTSIYCSSQFVHCILSKLDTIPTRRTPSYCNASDIERGFKMEETNINWSDDEVDDTKPGAADYDLYS